MLRTKKLVMTLCLLWAAGALVYASSGYSQTRGELLYSTHCITCHTTIIHWREKTLATDWHSLKTQVRRWQSTIGIGWSEDEITDVTRYLNEVYYHFSATENQTLTESDNPYPDSSP
jgi:mono/diheme cytochrome c family protein